MTFRQTAYPSIHFAILAAGEGSRLRQEGVETPKPLVKIGDIPMLERLIDIFIQNNAGSISIVINDIYPEVQSFLDNLKQKSLVPIRVIKKTTPSSLHSFYELLPYLNHEKICLTTVDTIFDADEFAAYIEHFMHLSPEWDGLMGVTSYVDDERPLYVETEKDNKITGFFDLAEDKCSYVSGGIYGFSSPSVSDVLTEARTTDMKRMRNFQRKLLDAGLSLQAYPFSKIIDVDHVDDVAKAEQLAGKK